MKPRRLARWTGALLLAGFIASAGQALAQSNPAVPAKPQAILVRQPSNTHNPVTFADASFLQGSNTNSQAADDFVVPNNVFWHITSVSALGQEVGSGSSMSSLLVQFYSDSGSALPGGLLYSVSYVNGTYTDQSFGTLVVNLNPSFVAGPGHYWVSVQPQMSPCFGSNCRSWYWNESPGPYNAESAWQGSWVSNCRAWRPRVSTCQRPLDSTGNDLAFELDGFTAPIVGQVFLPLIKR